eukprot:2218341-Karenia_brevis.AAC.1
MMKSCDKGPVLNAMQKGLRETDMMHPRTGHIQTCLPLFFIQEQVSIYYRHHAALFAISLEY